MSYKYQVKIGGRTIRSNAPFTVRWTRNIKNNEKDDNQLIQVTKKAYYRTMYSSERQEISSNNDDLSTFKQTLLQRQIQNKNLQLSQLLKDCDLRNSNINFNFNFNK